jgi:hypothetical protein
MAVFIFTIRLDASSTVSHEPPFKYVGGTEDVAANCAGELRLTPSSLAFECAQHTVTVPYSAIEIMQYRSDLGRHVRRMKLKWKVSPPRGGGNKNRYFTLIYKAGGVRHAIVLEVVADDMRPYLAEIDLQAGRRVDVQRHEDYQDDYQ